jgi:DNA-binding winged helix-turn-helix (wHTH) protein
MPLYKFEDFVFDSNSHRLSQQSKKVELRPKALKLLGLLIENRHRIVSKAEIMSSVWGSDYARDHLLFQLISELRKMPLQSEFVRTQPNEGYQWNVPTKIIYFKLSDNFKLFAQPRAFVPKLLAASVITGLVCISLLALPAVIKKDASPAQTAQLPAYSALSNGIVALQNGQRDRAIEWLEFALLENPDSVESSLFLAETLYQQNRPEESSEHLLDVLGKTKLSAYNKATATNLLSRIREQQGRFSDALRYAQRSMQTEVLGQCSVDFFEQRIQMLESELGTEVAIAPNHSDMDEINGNENIPLSKKYVDQCQQLKDSVTQASSCLPLRSQGDVYAAIVRVPTLEFV